MSDGNVSNRHDPVFDAPRGVHDGIDRPGEPRIRRWRQFVAVFLLGIVIGREIRDWNAFRFFGNDGVQGKPSQGKPESSI